MKPLFLEICQESDDMHHEVLAKNVWGGVGRGLPHPEFIFTVLRARYDDDKQAYEKCEIKKQFKRKKRSKTKKKWKWKNKEKEKEKKEKQKEKEIH